MTEAGNGASAPRLERALTLRDLVLFNVVAVLGLRWLATAAKAGPAAISLWLLAALLFFIPQGLAVVDLSSRFPAEGGVYAWTKHTFGEGHGFLCGWCYWINNVLYYPNLLISTAVVATYMIGRGDSGLAGQWSYVLPVTIAALWIAVGMNIVGVHTGRWLQNLGGIGSFLPGVVLVLCAAYAVVTAPHAPANPFPPRSFVPDLTNLASLNLWASIAFAFAGLELSSTMGDEVEHPSRNLPRSIIIAAPLIALTYILGTASLLWLVPVKDMNIVSGFLQGIAVSTHGVPALAWLAPLSAAAYTLSTVGGTGAWLGGPARVAFVIGIDRYFPPAFGRVHPRWRTPYVAILVQAGLATVFLLLSLLGKGTTVERAYLALLDTQLLVYFIPYLYLFLTFIKQSAGRERAVRNWLVGAAGFGVTLFAMTVASIPPEDTPDKGAFLLKVIGGAAAFVGLGLVLYQRGRRRR